MKKEEKKSLVSNENSFGVASVVLGILSILSFSMQGIILGIIGLFFSSKQEKQNPNPWSRMGKSLSIIGIVLNILLLIAAIILYAKYPQLFGNLPSIPA